MRLIGQRDQRRIQRARAQRFDQTRGQVLAHLQTQARKLLLQQRQRARQQERRDGRNGAQAKHAGRTARPPLAPRAPVLPLRRSARAARSAASSPAGVSTAPRAPALDQRRAQRRLQILDPGATASAASRPPPRPPPTKLPSARSAIRNWSCRKVGIEEAGRRSSIGSPYMEQPSHYKAKMSGRGARRRPGR